MNKFYITTTLPYANALPHIGHTLEFIQADVIARYQRRNRGTENVHFNVGTDEHGLKLYKKAQEESLTAKEYVDKYAARWQEFCELFQISHDSFYRTSEPYHNAPVEKFWREVDAKGYIYTKKYEGLYCVGCEEFITEKDLDEKGNCPDHNQKPIEYSEENYFFKLSAFRDQLLQWLDKNPEVLKPKKRLGELKNWISYMDDISISRLKENLPWGIDVPDDPEQVIYVWFDALIDYISAVGFGRPDIKKDVEEWWPGVQCFGPDNLRFQGGIWQGMLAAIGLPQTQKLLCHGMVLGPDGTKMSKTKGNVISPFDQLEKFGLEAVRFYLISGISTFGDSPFKEDDLINLYNSHLANNFGNLLNRVIHLSGKREIEINKIDDVESEFKVRVDEFVAKANSYYEEYELQLAAQTTNELATFGNKYIDEAQPWSKEIELSKAAAVLNNLSYLLQQVIELYAPIIPESAEKAQQALENGEKIVLFPKIETE